MTRVATKKVFSNTTEEPVGDGIVSLSHNPSSRGDLIGTHHEPECEIRCCRLHELVSESHLLLLHWRIHIKSQRGKRYMLQYSNTS